jgi:hypothetical protein
VAAVGGQEADMDDEDVPDMDDLDLDDDGVIEV